jgi:hypothetical protein
MEARLLLRERTQLAEDRFIEVVIWALPVPLAGSIHGFKYRLAFVVDEVCVLRYDNEAGKGDHKHVYGREVPYRFTTLDRLLRDFRRDVEEWRPG